MNQKGPGQKSQDLGCYRAPDVGFGAALCVYRVETRGCVERREVVDYNSLHLVRTHAEKAGAPLSGS